RQRRPSQGKAFSWIRLRARGLFLHGHRFPNPVQPRSSGVHGGVPILKRAATSLLFLGALSSMMAAQSLTARIDRDQLRISAPRLHFLTGEALERLRDGATVRYDFQLTVRSDRNGKALARAEEFFAISY